MDAQAEKDPPLDELLRRLDELTKQMPRSIRSRSKFSAAVSSSGDGDVDFGKEDAGLAQPEMIQGLARALARVEAAQEQNFAEFRRENAHTLGQLASALEHVGELSESSIQRLRAALGVAALESLQRRVPSELAEIKASLHRQAGKSIQDQKGGGHPFITVGLGIILLLVGVIAGTLLASFLVPWLHGALGIVF